MISVTSIVVIACALAISVQGQDACTQVLTGVTTKNAVPLEIVELTPHVADWRITIPEVCPKGKLGVFANVCDTDSPPQAYFPDMKILVVHRTGNLEGVGKVEITVYC